MTGRGRERRFDWRAVIATLPAPLVLFAGHMVGGASTPAAAGCLTAALAAIAGQRMLTGGGGGGGLPPDRAWLTGLVPAAWAFGAVLGLALLSVTPGSGSLGSGRFAALAAGRTLSMDVEATWVEIVKLCGLAIAFAMASAYASTPNRLRRTIAALVLLGGLWAVWAIALFAGEAGTGATRRLSAPFISPNIAGAYLGVLLLCWLALMGGGRTYRPGGGLGATGLLGLGLLFGAGLMLTASRSAIVITAVLAAVAVSAHLMPILHRRGWTRAGIATAAAVATVIVGVAANTSAGFLARLDMAGRDAGDRWLILTSYVEAARASPIFGYGLGATPRISRMILTPENESVMWNIRAVHNLPVQWWLEAGLAGSLAAAAGLAWLAVFTWRGLRPEGRRRLFPLLLAGPLLLLQGLVDYAAQIYSIALTWAFVLGLCYRVAAASDGYWDREPRTPGPRHIVKRERRG